MKRNGPQWIVRVLAVICLLGCDRGSAQQQSSIVLKEISERTLRRNITTQVEIQVSGWPEDVFCLWLPEGVLADFDDKLWSNGNAEQARQNFHDVAGNALGWQYEDERCRLTASITASKETAELACFVMNKSDKVMDNVYVQNCLHFPKAPSFRGERGDNVFFGSMGQWIPMSSTQHWFDRADTRLQNTTKFCFREASLDRGRYLTIRETRNVGPERSESSLIVKESADKNRAVGIAARGEWDFVFHNTNPKLGCIHSQPLPVRLEPGESVTFRQQIYFCNGGRNAVIEAFKKDPCAPSSKGGGSE